MLSSPSSEKNKQPILEVLRTFVNGSNVSSVLELASGSGVHVSFFAQNFPSITFQPSEIDRESLISIEAYKNELNLQNINSPIQVDLLNPDCYEAARSYDLVYASNFTHISPLECTHGAFKVASRSLQPNSYFVIYGPFSIDGVISPESNQSFDASLRSRNASWGYRDTSLMKSISESNGFEFERRISMPSNNWIMVFKKLWKYFFFPQIAND